MTTHRMLMHLVFADAFHTEADARAELLAKRPGPLGAYQGVWFAPRGGAVHLFTDVPLSELTAAGWVRHSDADDFDHWFRAVLDQIEGMTHAANVQQDDPEWTVSPVAGTDAFTVRSRRDARPIARVGHIEGILDGRAAALHIAFWSPQLALDLVRSAHAVLAEHSRYPSTSGRPVCDTCRDPGSPETAARYPCPTVRNVAHPFRRLPGYRQEWKP